MTLTDWRVHPGEVLREALDERDMPQTYLACVTGYTPKHINWIINGRIGVSAAMAVALEAELGIRAEFWMALQTAYDLHVAREPRS